MLRTSFRNRQVEERVGGGICGRALDGSVVVQLQGIRPGVFEVNRLVAISYYVDEGQGPALIGKAV